MSTDLAVRTAHRLNPNPRRVITKLFVPGEEMPRSRSRASTVISRILALDEAEVTALADAVIGDFRGRHRDLTRTFSEHFAVVAHEIAGPRRLSAERRMLIGAYFTHEYAPEAAALFNPSMAAHPDQSGLAEGQLRFVMTVRCVGEGHLSSIGFRTGVLGPGPALVVDEPAPLLTTGVGRPATYELRLFLSKLADLGDDAETTHLLLGALPEAFTASQLGDALTGIHEHTLNRERVQRTIEHIHQVAAATYDLEFPPETGLTERLLWPTAPVESHGMEDARLVRFEEDDASVTYYATYTAYSGRAIRSELIETTDFRSFRMRPLNGTATRNKGMGLFPRKINGRYATIGRQDNENLYLIYSDDLYTWDGGQSFLQPAYPWEFVQIGNCGSPIELDEGWLLLTHGVGPVRKYSIGAVLLDKKDPAKVLARAREPLVRPELTERAGYVPNVVYTCGAMRHGDRIVLPYAISDTFSNFATIKIAALLEALTA